MNEEPRPRDSLPGRLSRAGGQRKSGSCWNWFLPGPASGATPARHHCWPDHPPGHGDPPGGRGGSAWPGCGPAGHGGGAGRDPTRSLCAAAGVHSRPGPRGRPRRALRLMRRCVRGRKRRPGPLAGPSPLIVFQGGRDTTCARPTPPPCSSRTTGTPRSPRSPAGPAASTATGTAGWWPRSVDGPPARACLAGRAGTGRAPTPTRTAPTGPRAGCSSSARPGRQGVSGGRRGRLRPCLGRCDLARRRPATSSRRFPRPGPPSATWSPAALPVSGPPGRPPGPAEEAACSSTPRTHWPSRSLGPGGPATGRAAAAPGGQPRGRPRPGPAMTGPQRETRSLLHVATELAGALPQRGGHRGPAGGSSRAPRSTPGSAAAATTRPRCTGGQQATTSRSWTPCSTQGPTSRHPGGVMPAAAPRWPTRGPWGRGGPPTGWGATTTTRAATLGLLDRTGGFAPGDRRRGQPRLLGACHGGQRACARYLLDRGADID